MSDQTNGPDDPAVAGQEEFDELSDDVDERVRRTEDLVEEREDAEETEDGDDG